jgi:hypothetical protein
MSSYRNLELQALLDCGYRNASDRMVIVRCCGPEEFYLERVVFPFELLSFQCPRLSAIEIWTHSLGGPELVETVTADELIVQSPLGTASVPVPETLVGGGDSDLSPWLQAG